MKNNKFVIVTGSCMFLLLMMIIFNVGVGTKSTYSVLSCPSGYNYFDSNTNLCCKSNDYVIDDGICCPSGYSNYWNGKCINGSVNSNQISSYYDDGSCQILGVTTKTNCWSDNFHSAASIVNVDESEEDSSTNNNSSSPSSSTAPTITSCPNGTFSSITGCSACNAGYVLVDDTSLSTGGTDSGGVAVKKCDACPSGKVCPGGTESAQSCTDGKVPNAAQTECVDENQSTTTVTPKLSVSVDSENKIHVSLTSFTGCGGTIKVTGSGLIISGSSTSSPISKTNVVASHVTGAYTAMSGSTKGTVTATYTVTDVADGVTCTSPVTKTITVFDNTPDEDDTITETVCKNGGGTWSNNACSCPTGKTWSNVSKKCICSIGSKEVDGVCKLSAGISVSANKDVLVNTTHPVIVSTTNGATCGGKVSVTSSLGNSVSGFDVIANSKTLDYKPTKTGTDTLTFTYSGIDTSKCYMNDSSASFTLTVTADRKAMCEKYYGTWNSTTNTCNCNNGYYWSNTYNKCLAYSAAEDPTRIGPYLQLNWTEKKIKVGETADLTVCAKASNSSGAAGVAGRYYMSGNTHSGGTMTQMEVPAGGCTTVTLKGLSVGKDTVKIEFSPSNSTTYKPVSTNVEICVYDKDSSVCGSGNGGNGGGDGGDGTTGGNTGGTTGNSNTTSNPQTGSITIFLVWVIGLAIVGYSFWYFKNLSKNSV